MPQMSNMMWLFLMLYFILLYVYMLVFLYFKFYMELNKIIYMLPVNFKIKL